MMRAESVRVEEAGTIMLLAGWRRERDATNCRALCGLLRGSDAAKRREAAKGRGQAGSEQHQATA